MALVQCTECNSSVSTQASCCPHCGAPASGGTSDAKLSSFLNSLLCQKEFNSWALNGEQLLIDSRAATYSKNLISADWGEAYLTNHRVIFCGKSGGLMKLAAVPVFAVMTAGAFPKITLQFLVRDIVRVEEKRFGFGKTTIFKMVCGKTHKLSVDDSSTWKEQLTKLGVDWI